MEFGPFLSWFSDSWFLALELLFLGEKRGFSCISDTLFDINSEWGLENLAVDALDLIAWWE